ncbi:hypothetical protein JTE90_013233 [Oedothorax gibbosus]|uniref:Uncharacterized protein n=1 Tax=Oedothorax gibbosus TaxID=931172 RepID=A0AAV6VFH8_9ARAC|nr:hypothetical protein JTE90_013233 [Oedothorax gibbosus]
MMELELKSLFVVGNVEEFFSFNNSLESVDDRLQHQYLSKIKIDISNIPRTHSPITNPSKNTPSLAHENRPRPRSINTEREREQASNHLCVDFTLNEGSHGRTDG